MLKKKYVVQKSFRINQELELDLGLLAELTNRTQNDLVNNAIENCIIENKYWIGTNIIVEHYSPIFDATGEEYDDVFTMQNLKVDLQYGSGEFIISYEAVEDGEDVKYEKRIPYSGDGEFKEHDELKACLRYLAMEHLDFEKEDMINYLKERLNYKAFK